jgi:hypothetical protein
MERKKGPRRGEEKGRRSRHGLSRGKRKDALARLQKALLDAVREFYPHSPGEGGDGEREIHVRLQAAVIPGEDWRLEAKPSVGSQIESAVREATAREKVFRPGHVYCYRCESSHCEHGSPPAPERVFGGYSPTGQPLWPELAQFLMELKHPGVEGLYRQPGRTLAAAYVEPESLKLRQLGIFGKGSKTYDILAQAVFGYLRFPPFPGGDPQGDRTAFTLQAVEIRDRGRRPRVVLNVIGKLSDGSEAMEMLTGPRHMRVLEVVVTARRLVGKLRPSTVKRVSSRESGKASASASAVLRKATRSLERLGRQSERRTMHAEKRHTERRPTAKALEDAATVQDEGLLADDREGTIIVLGSRKRAHVFSPEGRHITSLSLNREEVESRKRRKRWRPLDREDRRRFQASIQTVLRK